MKVNLGIWPTLTRLLFILLFLISLFLVAFWYLPLIQQNQRLRRDILRLNQQIQHEEEKARQNASAIHALRNDPRAIERIARERYGYALPDEKVVRFDPPNTNPVVKP